MKIPNRLRHLREQKGWTQEDLSKASGVERANISRYESGDPIAPSIQVKLAKALGADVGDLFFSTTVRESQHAYGVGEQKMVLVPFLGRIAASPDGKEYFDTDGVPTGAAVPFFAGNGKKFFALEIENDSLINATPEIYPGDICIFESLRQPKSGDIVAIHLENDRRLVKVLKHLGRDEVELISMNKFRSYPSLKILKDQIRTFGIFVAKLQIGDAEKKRFGLKI